MKHCPADFKMGPEAGTNRLSIPIRKRRAAIRPPHQTYEE
jgi:hypothetical protein